MELNLNDCDNNAHNANDKYKTNDDLENDLSLYSVNSEKKNEISYNISSIMENSRLPFFQKNSLINNSLFPIIKDEDFKKIKTRINRSRKEVENNSEFMNDVTTDELIPSTLRPINFKGGEVILIKKHTTLKPTEKPEEKPTKISSLEKKEKPIKPIKPIKLPPERSR